MTSLKGSISSDDLVSTLNTSGAYWLGAASFEARSTSSLQWLSNHGVHIKKGVLFDYPTTLSPKSAGEQSRAFNRAQLTGLLRERGSARMLHPYRYMEFVGELYRISREVLVDPEVPVILDISCLTKIHTLAAAYWLSTKSTNNRVVLAYSTPDRYGSSSRNIWGKGRWTTTMLLSLDPDATDTYSMTSAVVLLGHEGDRLRLALNEIDAAEGLIIKALPTESDVSAVNLVTEAQNAWLGLELQKGMRPRFRPIALKVDELASFFNTVTEFAMEAALRGARVVLCPFGPKPFVFLGGYACLNAYPSKTWLSYPIPASYDTAYSSGYRETIWFEPLSLLSR